MLDLHQIAKKYNCDKFDLGYTKHYEKSLRVLETMLQKY